MTIVALIPARGGSKRVPKKNTRFLAGHPLIAYTIAAAKESGVFSDIQVWTDDPHVQQLEAVRFTAVYMRDPSPDDEPDITWVRVWGRKQEADAFAILRPTSPFRTASTIRRAWRQFQGADVDSIRAMEPWMGPHPGKMWTYDHVTCRLCPVLKEWTAHAPYHSSPTQSLVPVLRQNASLEMAWTRVLSETPPTISGSEIAPFFTLGYEGFDINTETDWQEAERLIASGEAVLPTL